MYSRRAPFAARGALDEGTPSAEARPRPRTGRGRRDGAHPAPRVRGTPIRPLVKLELDVTLKTYRRKGSVGRGVFLLA